MVTAREIINMGYREANFAAAQAVLTDTELSEGLTILQGLQDSLAGLVTGIILRPWYVPSPQRTAPKAAEFPARYGVSADAVFDTSLPPANARLLMRNPGSTTIWFQFQPDDGAMMEYVDVGHTGEVRLEANGALFGLSGSSTAVVIPPVFPAGRNSPRRWVYRMDRGAWIEVTPLSLDAEIPYPPLFNDYFITLMAIRLAPRFGQEPRQATVLRYQEMLSLIRAQWQQNAPQINNDLGVPALQVWDDLSHGGDFAHGNPT